MLNHLKCRWVLAIAACPGIMLFAQEASPAPVKTQQSTYILGTDDTLTVHALDLEEIGTGTFAVDQQGNINVPLAGRIHASGLSVEQLEHVLAEKLREYLTEPVVTVGITTYRPQPVSVTGAVNLPGVHQIRGQKTLLEALAEAGGIKPEAGAFIKIARRKEEGPIPLAGAEADSSGEYTVAQVRVKSLMDARNPQDNIEVKAQDAITVPKADSIYVLGAVKRAGGFVLSERDTVSALQALSMAEGLDNASGAAPDKATILRSLEGGNRKELEVDLKKMLAGKIPDVQLLANDILFVPTSTGRKAALRSIEAAIQMGTMVVAYSAAKF